MAALTTPGPGAGASGDSMPLSVHPNSSHQDENTNWEIGFHRPGIDAPIFTFTEFDGKLVAGGAFVQAGQSLSRYIASWDGERWEPLGVGMDGSVVALTRYRGALIAGGTFRYAAGQPASYIARWNGISWEALGEGTNGPVWSLTVYQDRLVVGGFFTGAGGTVARNLAVWDGTAWDEFHGGTDGDVLGLLARDGELYATGDFAHAGSTAARHIARWTGTGWTALGEGLGDRGAALADFQGRLIAAGDFLTAGGVEAAHIAAWDGAAWSPLGAGATHTIHQLVLHEDRLVVTGAFTHAGGVAARGVAAWDGVSWAPVGDPLNDRGTAVATFHGQLYLSGYFGFAGTEIAEGSSLDYLARLEQDRWRPVFDARARGMNGPIYSLVHFEGGLIAAGNFTVAGNTPVYRVARWDGRSWQSLGDGFSDTVFALRVIDGTLYAGGLFIYNLSGVELNGIAVWDGTTWRPVGSGFNRPIYDIEGWGGLLVAAGAMSSTGGRAINRVVFWDGLTWRSLGEGIRGSVRDLALHEGQLYAAGSFSLDGTDTRFLARWTGTRWEGVPHPFEEAISAVISVGGSLVVGGYFNTRGTVSMRRVARWNGTSWLPMGEGFDAPINALCVHQGMLLAAGQFTKSGDTPTHGLARWDGSAWLPFGTGVSSNTVIPEVISIAGAGDRLFVGGYFSRAGNRVANYFAEWSPYVPATLSGFAAARSEGAVLLQWTLGGTMEDSPEFNVYRESAGESRIKLTAHPLWGETEYRFVDPAPPTAAATYWLAEIDREGGVTWHGPVEVAAVRIPAFRLAQNAPNPFLVDTRISFQVPATEHVSLVIYDLSGGVVARLADGVYPEGEYEVTWDGRNVRGSRVAAGLYFARLRSPSGSQVRKLLKQSPGP